MERSKWCDICKNDHCGHTDGVNDMEDMKPDCYIPQHMKVSTRLGYMKGEYVCELTVDLDKIAGLDTENKPFYCHYLLDSFVNDKSILPIRVPGGTVGGIRLDENNAIIDIKIDRNYTIKTYPEDINEVMKKYIGTIVEL